MTTDTATRRHGDTEMVTESPRHRVSASGLIVVALALGLPFTTRIVGWAPYPQHSMEWTPLYLLLVGGLLVLALRDLQDDPWLAALAAWMLVRAAAAPLPGGIPAASWVVIGAGCIAAARRIPAAWGPRVALGLGIVGGIEAYFALVQWGLGFDLWTAGWRQPPAGYAHGTLGNYGFLGGFLALAAPIAPAWLLVLIVPAIVVSHSVTAGVAAAVGLGIRYRRSWRWLLPIAVLLLAVGIGHRGIESARASALERVEFARVAAASHDGISALVGHGPGAWMAIATQWQREHGKAAVGSALHSEPVQLHFEGGLVALVLAGGWCWAHRRAVLASPWGGSLAALAVFALTWFPFRIGVLAAPALLVIGMATRTGHGGIGQDGQDGQDGRARRGDP